MKIKEIARKSRGHWRETEMQENARAEREEPDSGNEKGKGMRIKESSSK